MLSLLSISVEVFFLEDNICLSTDFFLVGADIIALLLGLVVFKLELEGYLCNFYNYYLLFDIDGNVCLSLKIYFLSPLGIYYSNPLSNYQNLSGLTPIPPSFN